MRKYFLTICVCFMTVIASAQVTSITGKSYRQITSNKDTVYVFIFNGISATDTIKYTGTANNANWFEYSETISNTSNYFPDLTNLKDSTGYILVVDGKKTNVWVIDYKKHLPVFTSFEPENNPGIQCENVKLLYSPNLLLNYSTQDNKSYPLERDFTVTYKTKEWGTDDWNDKADTASISLPISEISVPAPLCNTDFTISGDQYAADLGIKLFTKTSLPYTAVAVKCHPTSSVTKRDELNEAERPNETAIKGSAPFDILFKSNANVPVTFYKWEIFKDEQLWNIRSGLDQEQRYNFNEAGVYNLKLTVSNENHCSYIDSTITITISTSQIQVPNVFTPNGDSYNNEFRVAYKSITSFEAWVYNRWGRLVFHWTDPTKGWDGTINGRKAATGPYYYVIKALGSDFDPNSTPIGKTKLRLGEYLLKGDINLLRGKE